jgi:phospholipase C
MFEPNLGSSIPSHLAMVSGWSARCAHPTDVTTCRPNIVNPDNDEDFRVPGFAWTDLTYLLHANGVDWGWYIVPGAPPDCDRGAPTCTSKRPPAWDLPGTPELWNVLPDFATVHEDRQLGRVQTSDRFFAAAREGSLPAVSWVLPDWPRSDHPSSSLARGQTWVTSLVNAVMKGPDWESSAILLSWDDWGGFYDHVVPPKVDPQGYGLRVPGLLISPYAKRGFVDHQVLSFDAYLKLIEDLFMGGRRIDPATDGRPDPRPNVREDAAILGDLLLEFDFSQPPLRLVLSVHPKPGPASRPDGS